MDDYKPTQFMLPTSNYVKSKADRAVNFINALCHTKSEWHGQPFNLIEWQEQIIRTAIRSNIRDNGQVFAMQHRTVRQIWE